MLAVVLLACSCQKNDMADFDDNSYANAKNELVSSDTLYSMEELQSIFAQRNYTIDWNKERDPKLIYSIIMHTDSSVNIGYKPIGVGNVSPIVHQINIESSEWKSVENRLRDTIVRHEKQLLPAAIRKPSSRLPIIAAKIRHYSTLKTISQMPEVLFLEVTDDFFSLRPYIPEVGTVRQYIPDPFGKIGCTCDTPAPYNEDDVYVELPGVVRPWNYEYHNINDDTWAISSGQGVGVAVIDSGLSFAQENLDGDADFNSGWSSGRSQSSVSFLPFKLSMVSLPYMLLSGWIEQHDASATANDQCGHGTRMAGLIGAPRGMDLNAVGVAYNCNLDSYRTVHNSIINTTGEKNAVTEAIVTAGIDPTIQVVSMSIGQIPGASSPSIGLALDFAYNNGKMLVCAAGTAPDINSVFDPVFPANHSKTIAVTGIKEPASYPNALVNDDAPCKDCFYDEEVDFAVIMERSGEGNQSRNTLAVTCDGDIPSYSSGTSCATATLAGMAALVWSHLGTSATREDVLQKLQESASNPLGDHLKFGYGWVDMAKALEE